MATSLYSQSSTRNFFFLFQRLVGPSDRLKIRHAPMHGQGVRVQPATLISSSFLDPTFFRQLKLQAARVHVFSEQVYISDAVVVASSTRLSPLYGPSYMFTSSSSKVQTVGLATR